jgi:hypothetical protein
MNKKTLGVVIVLGGIAFIGFIWFKRNKPTVGIAQLDKLKAQSNNLATSADSIDKPFQYTQQAVQNQGTNPYIKSLFEPNFDNLTVKEKEELRLAVNSVSPYSANIDNIVTGQIALNMQNADFSQLGNLGLANIDWSNIKIQ